MILTKKLIDAASYAGAAYANGTQARQVLWDDKVPGFGCRLLPSGKKSFLLSYRVAGRKRQMTLGTYGVVTLDAARKLARAHLAQIETTGADPLATREQEAQGETVADLCAAYLERYAKPHKKTWADDERRINNRILPRWGKLKARAITTTDAAALHTAIGGKEAKPYEANRVRALLSKMFNLGKTWGFVPKDFENPTDGIDDFREQKRDRWVKPDELPRLAQAINEESNEVARHALWLYLLTGTRKHELLAARWDWIDWDRAELRLPDTKADRVHYVPLSGPAVALLRDMPRIEGNPYLLPGRGHRGMSVEDKALHPTHLVNIQKPWNRVRIAAGVADVRLHDLRRTVGSWLAQAGNSLHLIGRVLNHSNASTTQVYARFGEDSVRTALEQHGARIMGASGLTPSAEILPLPARRRTA